VSFVGIDVGTTRIKVLVYDGDRGQCLAQADAETPVMTTELGLVHRPGDLLRVVMDTVATALASSTLGDPVEAFAVASVGEELVLVDERGSATDDVPTWYNPLGRDMALRVIDGIGGLSARRVRLDPSVSLFKLLWLAEHRPWALKRAASFTDLGSYITGVLAGRRGRDLVMDWSHASRTGLYRPASHDWDDQLLGLAGVVSTSLPSLVPSGTAVGLLAGPFAVRWGISGRCTVVAGGHDHFCAAFACGVRDVGEAFVSAGTSEAQLVLVKSPPDTSGADDIDFGSYVDSLHSYLHKAIPSGHLFRQWRSKLYPGVSDAQMYSEIELVSPGSDGIHRLVKPQDWWNGRAAIPHGCGRAHVMRALMESLALASSRVTDSLEAASDQPIRRVISVGTPTRQPLWRQIRAAMTERQLIVLDIDEPAALGAALLAQRGATGSTQPPKLRAHRVEALPALVDAYRGMREEYSDASTATAAPSAPSPTEPHTLETMPCHLRRSAT
jgi:xylulokinase